VKLLAWCLLALAACLLLAGLTWPDFTRGHRLGCMVGAFVLCLAALLTWMPEKES